MIATIDYVRRKFGEFNQLMFGGRLPDIPIELSDASRFLGLFVCNVRRTADGRRENHNFRLRINTRIDLPQTTLDDVIIHEMIHYFIAVHNLEDTSSHGHIFRSIMESINRTHGRHIQVSHREMTDEQREQAVSKRPTWHIIAEIEFRDGSYGVKVLPRVAPKVQKYVDTVERSPKVRSVRLFLHNNPFFNRFPTSAALNYQSIEHDVFVREIGGAQELEARNGKIYQKR